MPGAELAMHCTEHDFDLILADGVFVLLDYPTSYKKLACAVQRCLKHDGIFMVRSFLRPPAVEPCATIFAELWDKSIGSFHAFKWRLLMSLQGDDTLDDIEVKLVVEQPLTSDKETRLTTIIHDALGHAFPLRFSYFPQELPKTRSGKFEEFVSLV